ncbi:DUF2807 domain-containing protein [Sphingomonas sp. CL5.1]|uniref:GIN domain-containing protein n=1 Tax=Sphingomonas sp. CL5.1 TaxID=2653203 RepID=UPI001583C21F|nr:DUF2807 domain-containing protein [Sphingomonas sp. CL5.1]QKR98882.1 DUF2807 domain-containing protein [Sphingomonas sp. CL5.1]
MRPVLLALPLAAIAATAGAASWDSDRGPGIAPRRDGGALVYPVDGFSSIGLALPARVDVRVGPAFSVRATGPAQAFADVRVTRKGDSLQIEQRYPGHARDERALRAVRFVVTMPRIRSASIASSGGIDVDRVAGDRFDGAIGGSGSLTLGNVAVERLSGSIGGSGSIIASGDARQLTVNLGGSGRFSGERLHARAADISIAGSGGVRARVDGDARVSIAGSGDADLGPRARCAVSRVGSGKALCGGH